MNLSCLLRCLLTISSIEEGTGDDYNRNAWWGQTGGGRRRKRQNCFFLCHSGFVAHINDQLFAERTGCCDQRNRARLDQREEKRPIWHFLFLRESKVTRVHQVGASIGFALGGSIISTNLKVLVHAIDILGWTYSSNWKYWKYLFMQCQSWVKLNNQTESAQSTESACSGNSHRG